MSTTQHLEQRGCHNRNPMESLNHCLKPHPSRMCFFLSSMFKCSSHRQGLRSPPRSTEVAHRAGFPKAREIKQSLLIGSMCHQASVPTCLPSPFDCSGASGSPNPSPQRPSVKQTTLGAISTSSKANKPWPPVSSAAGRVR